MAIAKKTNEMIQIKPIEIRKSVVRVVGDTPLIMHAWSEKAKKMMLDAQMGKKAIKKEAKNPVADFIDSMYWLSGKPNIEGKSVEECEQLFEQAIADGATFGFPVTAFKQAAISGAYRQKWVKDKASLRGEFFIDSDENGLVQIHSDAPVIREDCVRIGQGTADLRYRGEFDNWYADLVISYNVNGQYGFEDIVNIINAGGFFCGVGEWRPERDGQYGMYHVDAKA